MTLQLMPKWVVLTASLALGLLILWSRLPGAYIQSRPPPGLSARTSHVRPDDGSLTPAPSPTSSGTPTAGECVRDANKNGQGDVVDIITTASDACCLVYLPLVVSLWRQPWPTLTPTRTATPTATPPPAATLTASVTPSPTLPVSASPALFFTDLESGPNSGGQDNLGAFITLWGEGFGATRGNSTVTIGGREVARYVIWGQNQAVARSLDLIVVQPGPNVTSGAIVVTVNGSASTPLPFTVRPGNIYFVSTVGNDASAGSFAQPWRTIVKAKNRLAAGDIAYIADGVTESAEENFGAVLSIETSGASAAPKALIAYPGAAVTVGSTGLEFGLRVPNIGIAAHDWVIAKLVLRGQTQALDIGGDGSSRWRIVGNDISCPVGDGQTGCFAASQASHIAFLGNAVHGISQQGSQPSKQYHAVYFTTDTNHVEVGWNHVDDNRTCRAIQFHSSPLDDGTGYNQYDLSVHDNLIHGDVCDGINFATVDPSRGPVRAFNNVIYDVGRGPSPPDGDANYAGIYVAGGTNTGPDGAGVVEIFNNTLYDCGAAKNSDAGAFARGLGSPGLFMRLRNNSVYAVGGEDYIAPSSATALITGANNLWFGGGPAPAFLPGNVSADPLFVNRATGDFRLRAGSPAIDAGTDTGPGTDYAGSPRPQGAAYDIGAYEWQATMVVSASRSRRIAKSGGHGEDLTIPAEQMAQTKIIAQMAGLKGRIYLLLHSEFR